MTASTPHTTATASRVRAAAPRSPLARAFVARANESPMAVAVSEQGVRFTYGELDAASDELAASLGKRGARAGSLIAIRLPRGTGAYIAMLAALKIDGAYLPLDPADETERSDFIVADSCAEWLIEVDSKAPDQPVVRSLSNQCTYTVPPDTAYVIYTSGSTGRPKGVPVAARSAVALLEASAAVYDFRPTDVWSQFHAVSFDFSVWELWGALTSGATVAVVPPETTRNPYELAEFLAAERVSVLSQVPTSFDALTRALQRRPRTFPALRYVVFGGEPIRPDAIEAWRAAAVAPAARLMNMYGITETTVHATCADVTDRAHLRHRNGATYIGVPLAHLEIRAVDPETMEQVPAGLPGELLITGSAVAPGYVGRPEATAERFIRLRTDPQSRVWYRSGDFGFHDGSGWWYCGRADDQVQVKGVRIELGEVEAAVRTSPLVEDCAVSAPASADGRRTLVAAYIPADPGADPVETARLLRGHLAQLLPGHLVPAAFIPLERLPVSNGGKLDRRALEELWLSGGPADEGGTR